MPRSKASLTPASKYSANSSRRQAEFVDPARYRLERLRNSSGPGGSRPNKLNQPVLDSVPGQLRVDLHMHFVQNAPFVGAHRLDAKVHFECDVRQPLAPGQSHHDLQLAL